MSNKVIEADANKAIVDEFLNAFSTGDVPRIYTMRTGGYRERCQAFPALTLSSRCSIY